MKSNILAESEIRRVGWKVLVKNMGLANATRFILQYEKGEGNYSGERQKIFGTKTVEELIREAERQKRKSAK